MDLHELDNRMTLVEHNLNVSKECCISYLDTVSKLGTRLRSVEDAILEQELKASEHNADDCKNQFKELDERLRSIENSVLVNSLSRTNIQKWIERGLLVIIAGYFGIDKLI